LFDIVRKYGLMTVVVIGVIVAIVFNYDRNQMDEEETNDLINQLQFNEVELENNDEVKEEPSMEENWFVDVKGEVKQPGLYKVKQNTRVKNVIDLAGGFTDDAAVELINLAQKITDEMVIYVPKKGEEIEQSIVTNTNLGRTVTTEHDKVRINDATVDELTKLNGIGPSKAEAIITYREENGPFKTVDDLLQVNGIGEKTLENIRDDIIVP
jgi:competence protein ComEA